MKYNIKGKLMNNKENGVVIDEDKVELIKEAMNKKKEDERNGGHYRMVSFVSGDFKVEVKYELVNLVNKTVFTGYNNDTAKEEHALNVRHIGVVRISKLYGTPDKGFVTKDDFIDLVIKDAEVNVIDFKVIKKAKKVYKQIIFKDV